MSFKNPILLAVLFLTVATFAQEDCPSPVAECPDNCERAQCGRFLNAKCQENPCHGLCTPNFFWRGRNVTSRCDVERCADKICPRRRQCLEENVPSSCPANRPLCRQYIRARCVLPPKPTDCSQISCEPGLFCRERKRGGGVRCVRARNCEQLTCDAGFSCNETDNGPQCIREQPMVQCSEELTTLCRQRMGKCEVVDGVPQCVLVTDCDDIKCEPGLQCTVLRNVTGQDIAICASDIAPTCQNTTCSLGALCVELSLPSIRLSVGACLSRDFASIVPIFEQSTCAGNSQRCDQETQVCVDIFEGGQFLSFTCYDLINCTDNSSCFSYLSYQLTCAEVPSDVIDLGFTDVCVPAGETRFEFGGSCATVTKQCSPGLTCQDIAISGNIVGTTCGVSTAPSIGPSCNELNCRAPEQCYEVTVAERGGLALCYPEVLVEFPSNLIRSFINASDDPF